MSVSGGYGSGEGQCGLWLQTPYRIEAAPKNCVDCGYVSLAVLGPHPKTVCIVATRPLPYHGHTQKLYGFWPHIPCLGSGPDTGGGTWLESTQFLGVAPIRHCDCVSPAVSRPHPKTVYTVATYPLLYHGHTQKLCGLWLHIGCRVGATPKNYVDCLAVLGPLPKNMWIVVVYSLLYRGPTQNEAIKPLPLAGEPQSGDHPKKIVIKLPLPQAPPCKCGKPLHAHPLPRVPKWPKPRWGGGYPGGYPHVSHYLTPCPKRYVQYHQANVPY